MERIKHYQGKGQENTPQIVLRHTPSKSPPKSILKSPKPKQHDVSLPNAVSFGSAKLTTKGSLRSPKPKKDEGPKPPWNASFPARIRPQIQTRKPLLTTCNKTPPASLRKKTLPPRRSARQVHGDDGGGADELRGILRQDKIQMNSTKLSQPTSNGQETIEPREITRQDNVERERRAGYAVSSSSENELDIKEDTLPIADSDCPWTQRSQATLVRRHRRHNVLNLTESSQASSLATPDNPKKREFWTRAVGKAIIQDNRFSRINVSPSDSDCAGPSESSPPSQDTVAVLKMKRLLDQQKQTSQRRRENNMEQSRNSIRWDPAVISVGPIKIKEGKLVSQRQELTRVPHKLDVKYDMGVQDGLSAEYDLNDKHEQNIPSSMELSSNRMTQGHGDQSIKGTYGGIEKEVFVFGKHEISQKDENDPLAQWELENKSKINSKHSITPPEGSFKNNKPATVIHTATIRKELDIKLEDFTRDMARMKKKDRKKIETLLKALKEVASDDESPIEPSSKDPKTGNFPGLTALPTPTSMLNPTAPVFRDLSSLKARVSAKPPVKPEKMVVPRTPQKWESKDENVIHHTVETRKITKPTLAINTNVPPIHAYTALPKVRAWEARLEHEELVALPYPWGPSHPETFASASQAADNQKAVKPFKASSDNVLPDHTYASHPTVLASMAQLGRGMSWAPPYPWIAVPPANITLPMGAPSFLQEPVWANTALLDSNNLYPFIKEPAWINAHLPIDMDRPKGTSELTYLEKHNYSWPDPFLDNSANKHGTFTNVIGDIQPPTYPYTPPLTACEELQRAENPVAYSTAASIPLNANHGKEPGRGSTFGADILESFKKLYPLTGKQTPAFIPAPSVEKLDLSRPPLEAVTLRPITNIKKTKLSVKAPEFVPAATESKSETGEFQKRWDAFNLQSTKLKKDQLLVGIPAFVPVPTVGKEKASCIQQNIEVKLLSKKEREAKEALRKQLSMIEMQEILDRQAKERELFELKFRGTDLLDFGP